jgi:hypothetical protein
MTMPAFVFIRERQVEIETGLTLAGQLITSWPKNIKLKKKHQRQISALMQELKLAALAGRIPDDAIAHLWDRSRPLGAINPTIEELQAWAKDHIVIAVRIDPRNDGIMRLGETDMRRLGVISTH